MTVTKEMIEKRAIFLYKTNNGRFTLETCIRLAKNYYKVK